MTGPEHYKRAEELEQLAEEEWRRSNYGWAPVLIARAQVHATLAAAAATANAAYGLMAAHHDDAWRVVFGESPLEPFPHEERRAPQA